jgi:hypothetical protein
MVIGHSLLDIDYSNFTDFLNDFIILYFIIFLNTSSAGHSLPCLGVAKGEDWLDIGYFITGFYATNTSSLSDLWITYCKTAEFC